MKTVLVSGGFDDIRARDIRFLQEAARLGPVTVRLKSDAVLGASKFSFGERAYILKALRYVTLVEEVGPALPDPSDMMFVVREREASIVAEAYALDHGATYKVISESALDGFPLSSEDVKPGAKTVAVSGCYDWLHSGHVRFFEEAAGYGDLHVFLGSDTTICELKGAGHPQFSDEERRYVVGSIRHVASARISRGNGMLDFAEDVQALKPDFFIVNEDGHKPAKAEFCHDLGIEYVVLKRTPAEGLPVRSSTALRGF